MPGSRLTVQWRMLLFHEVLSETEWCPTTHQHCLLAAWKPPVCLSHVAVASHGSGTQLSVLSPHSSTAAACSFDGSDQSLLTGTSCRDANRRYCRLQKTMAISGPQIRSSKFKRCYWDDMQFHWKEPQAIHIMEIKTGRKWHPPLWASLLMHMENLC